MEFTDGLEMDVGVVDNLGGAKGLDTDNCGFGAANGVDLTIVSGFGAKGFAGALKVFGTCEANGLAVVAGTDDRFGANGFVEKLETAGSCGANVLEAVFTGFEIPKMDAVEDVPKVLFVFGAS